MLDDAYAPLSRTSDATSARSCKGRNTMTITNYSTDNEQETVWYLGGQRIIAALGEQDGAALRLTEWRTPARTRLFILRQQQEEEAYYVLTGQATIVIGQDAFSISTGAFVFVPSRVPYQLEIDPSGPLHHMKWVAPTGFAHAVTKLGTADHIWHLAPPGVPEPAHLHQLAALLHRLAS
jgi:mannose-6-phosphate isomerase-like protein (cupin superfamily)